MEPLGRAAFQLQVLGQKCLLAAKFKNPDEQVTRLRHQALLKEQG